MNYIFFEISGADIIAYSNQEFKKSFVLKLFLSGYHNHSISYCYYKDDTDVCNLTAHIKIKSKAGKLFV